MSPNQGFSSLMYVIFIIEKKFRVDDTAKEMRITTDTLYRYCRGELIIPPDRIIDLINATHEIRFLNFFCEPCGFLPVSKVRFKRGQSSIRKKEVDLSITIGRALEIIEQAHSDGKITKIEYRDIHSVLNELMRKEAELDYQIKAEVKG